MQTAKIKKLNVETPEGHAGKLTKESRYVFNYETTSRDAEVSLVMPLRAQSYASGGLFSVFEMNRPEGYLLETIKKRFAKQGSLDDMALLKITGANQIGRLTYRDHEDDMINAKPQVTKEELIRSTASAELFEFLSDIYFNSGVSGFQPKVIVPNAGTGLSEKTATVTSSLIVKAAGEDYPFLAQNEFMCMEVARRAGLTVPPFWLSEDGGLFIMERFDLAADGQRFGLEDMAVLMGKSPEEKYNGSVENVAKAIDLFCGSNSVESKARLFEYIALSVSLRNGDAHLKNFSLIYDTPHGDVRLSPLYDVVTTMVYRIENPRTGATKVDNTMALNMFKTKNYPLAPALIAFGKSVCMVKNPEKIIERIEEAKHETLAKYQNRIDPWLYINLKSVWGGSGVVD
ncbi:MAG: type II toxin-antitoxin system HipA family toxin [Methylophilaceae bacterium]|nr:type II toxin-antitoxin system HipA family toxin [Methylophilaceae bacterium]